VFGINWRITAVKRVLIGLMLIGLIVTTVGCGDRLEVEPENELVETVAPTPQTKIVEVSPPAGIQKLRQAFDQYQPQVRILSPHPDETIEAETVKVQLEVRGLPIFQNPQLGLGPHLEFILDNQPAMKLYDLNEPLVLTDLLPGTHTIRVLAARPWDESYKNQGAYAQTTFHIYTKTEANNPDRAKPLLTYNLPKGSYGAEPIMLDFYLTNAPLHLVAQENPDDNIVDWRIRVTVNGSSFVVDRWEPIYLKGFDPGVNWVKLEFLDEQGNSVNNVFNNTARSLTYQPRGKDSLAKLIRGELSSAQVRSLVNPNYPVPTPETTTPDVEAIPEESPAAIPQPIVSEPISEPEISDRVNDQEAIEKEIEEPTAESPAVEATPEAAPEEIPQAVTPEPISEPISEPVSEEVINEEIPAGETVTLEETVEKNVPEASQPVTELTTSPAEVLEEIPEAATPLETVEKAETVETVETLEKATLPEETTQTTTTTETQESVTVKIRAMVEEAIAQILDFVNSVISFVKNINIDVKLPSLGGESQSPTPPAVD
jgi:hypothetical protein